jgi:alkylated DNA repair dioxygenase AlkB
MDLAMPSEITLHEQTNDAGELERIRLSFRGGRLAIDCDGHRLPLPDGALETVLGRYGTPLDTAYRSQVAEEEVLDLGAGKQLLRFRFRPRFDVIAKDYVALIAPDQEPLSELATGVTAALQHLARSLERASARTWLGPHSFLIHERGLLSAADADRRFRALRECLAWEQREIVLFGKRIVQPRLIAWAGEVPYRYSGQTLPVRSFPVPLAELRVRVEAASGAHFNHALANLYRDQNDAMGFHSDDEPELGDDPVLASLTLGATRRFVIHPKKKKSGAGSLTLTLGHGDLLVMGGAFQSEYRHGVPRERTPVGERINVTFRLISSDPIPR